MNVLWVAIASGFGSVLRFGLGERFPMKRFPWMTLVINVSGAFFAGWVLSLFVMDMFSRTTYEWLVLGFLGGFTTFSLFSKELADLLWGRAYMRAFLYSVGTFFLLVVSAIFGYTLGLPF